MKYYIVMFNNNKTANEAVSIVKGIKTSNYHKLFILHHIFKKKALIKQAPYQVLMKFNNRKCMVFATTKEFII